MKPSKGQRICDDCKLIISSHICQICGKDLCNQCQSKITLDLSGSGLSLVSMTACEFCSKSFTLNIADINETLKDNIHLKRFMKVLKESALKMSSVSPAEVNSKLSENQKRIIANLFDKVSKSKGYDNNGFKLFGRRR